jgi:hypothetical protein
MYKIIFLVVKFEKENTCAFIHRQTKKRREVWRKRNISICIIIATSN